MTKKWPTQERLNQLYTFNEVEGRFHYIDAPYRKPHLKGQIAGRLDKRDGIFYVPVDGKMYEIKKLISVFRTGLLPPAPPHHTQLTQEYVRSVLHYDPESGVFTRLQSAGAAKLGSRADYVENNGYRYVILNGKRMIAARLAWLYVTGENPHGRIFVKDENPGNIAFGNLEKAQFGSQKVPENKRAYDKYRRVTNKTSFRKSQLKRDFGISLEQYQDMFAAQGGLCACCGQPETQTYKGERKWLAVDHCHASGNLRQLLCAACNQGLGHFRDDPDLLRAAARYLERHRDDGKEKIVSLVGRKVANEEGNSG